MESGFAHLPTAAPSKARPGIRVGSGKKPKMKRGMSMRWLDTGRISRRLISLCFHALTFPYYLSYRAYTLNPIVDMMSDEDPAALGEKATRFLRRKAREAYHVQIMGGVAFASNVSALSWNDVPSRHWLCLACWYGSIVLAIGSVIVGTQQKSLIDALADLFSDVGAGSRVSDQDDPAAYCLTGRLRTATTTPPPLLRDRLDAHFRRPLRK
ncbi:hypothetical protein F5Y15DRAFT_411995 [Xylariaceae sp. FL0016]|nr:hypothetical protein F5Y15DRAFT_411995 [Xylariaceae sp. FL0016]